MLFDDGPIYWDAPACWQEEFTGHSEELFSFGAGSGQRLIKKLWAAKLDHFPLSSCLEKEVWGNTRFGNDDKLGAMSFPDLNIDFESSLVFKHPISVLWEVNSSSECSGSNMQYSSVVFFKLKMSDVSNGLQQIWYHYS